MAKAEVERLAGNFGEAAASLRTALRIYEELPAVWPPRPGDRLPPGFTARPWDRSSAWAALRPRRLFA